MTSRSFVSIAGAAGLAFGMAGTAQAEDAEWYRGGWRPIRAIRTSISS